MKRFWSFVFGIAVLAFFLGWLIVLNGRLGIPFIGSIENCGIWFVAIGAIVATIAGSLLFSKNTQSK